MWKKIFIGIGCIIIVLFIASYFVFQTGLFEAKPPQDGKLALTNGNFITMTTEELEIVSNKALLIEDGNISGFEFPENLPADIRTINLKGGYAMPGLIDLHVHLGALPIIEDFSILDMILEYGRRYPQSRKKFLEYGVTTVQSLGDPHPRIISLSNKIANNELAGPRIFAAGPILTAPGGHPVSTIYKGNSWLIENATRQLEDTTRARKVVRNLNKDGVDKIKVVFSAGPDSTLPRMKYDVLNAIVDEAHQQELRVVAHISSAYDIRSVMRAGVDGIEHLPGKAPKKSLVEKMQTTDLYVVPTLAVYKSLLNSTEFEETMSMFSDWVDREVKIALGTDAGNIPAGESVYTEMKLYVRAGMNPYDVLQTATINAARHIKAEDKLGSLEQGKRADIIVFEENPLKGLDSLKKPNRVFRDGRVYVSL